MPLVLGGVPIEYPRGLAGHSDGDVVTHALIDAHSRRGEPRGHRLALPLGRRAVPRRVLARPALGGLPRGARSRLGARQRRLRARGRGAADRRRAGRDVRAARERARRRAGARSPCARRRRTTSGSRGAARASRRRPSRSSRARADGRLASPRWRSARISDSRPVSSCRCGPRSCIEDPVANALLRGVRDEHPELQFFAWDDELEQVLAEGDAVPTAWDGDPETLPDRAASTPCSKRRSRRRSGAERPLRLADRRSLRTTQGRGLSRRMIERMAALGRARGFDTLIAPVRPSWKHRYPLVGRSSDTSAGGGLTARTSIPGSERTSGSAASILKVAPRSMVIPRHRRRVGGVGAHAVPGDGDVRRARAPVPVDVDAMPIGRLRRAERLDAAPAVGRPSRLGRGSPGSVKQTRAPPPSRSSAQIRPPCASTRPRAIASPSPAPRDEREWSPRQKRSNMRARASASRPSPVSSTATAPRPRAARRGPRPRRREGVCRSAFVRRFMSTRSSLSGAKRAVRSASTSASSRTCRLRGLRLDAAQRARDDRRDAAAGGARASARRRRCARARRGRRRGATAPAPARGAREVLLGLAEAVLERLEHRLHVRERRSEVVARPGDELAACVEEASEVLAHLVEGGGELGDLGRAVLGRPGLEVAARRARRTRRARGRSSRRSSGRATSAATIAVSADAAVTARIFTSSPMWNMTQPESSTAPSGSRTARKASPASCSRTVGSRRRRYASASPTASVATATSAASRSCDHGGNR